SAFDALFANQAFRPLVLLEGTGAIGIGAATFYREALSVFDELVGIKRRNRLDEMATPHAKHVIDEAFEFRRSRHSQMPFEDHAIKTMQCAYDEAGKLDQKSPYCAHGILPRLAELSTNHSGG